MRLYLSLFVILFILGCMKTPEVLVSEKITVEKTLQHNKSEAQQAKEDYLNLQKRRR